MGYLGQIEPPKDLEQQILKRIAVLAWCRAVSFLALAGASFAGLIYVLASIGQGLTQSSFYQYLQLIWTDQTSLFTYWRELGWSLLESLPVLGLVVIFVIVGLFLWSTLKALENNNYGFKKVA